MDRKTVLRGRVFDGDKVTEDGVVVFDPSTGIIESSGERGEVEEPSNSHIMDAKGMTITPGFIDAHMHFFGSKTLELSEWNVTPDATVAIRSVADMWNLLDSGFTTVRDLGSKTGTHLSRAEREGDVRGPRIISAAKSLAQTGGDDDYRILPIEMSHKLSYSYYCDSPWECRKAVRLSVRDGAEVVKVYASGTMSQGGKWKPHLTVDELSAIVDEGHRSGLKVTAHAYGDEAIKNVIQSNADSVEHGLGLTKETARLLREKGMYYVPTLTVYSIKKAEKGSMRERIVKRHLEEEVAVARELGVKIAAGTDLVGSSVVPHGNNSMEMELLSKDLGNLEALKAGTSVAADCVGLEDTGRLRNGNVADIVVVDGNPLDDINNISRKHVRHVFRSGIQFK